MYICTLKIDTRLGEFMEKNQVKRLAMYMPRDLHHELKMIAAKRNITMTAYVVNILTAIVHKEKQYE